MWAHSHAHAPLNLNCTQFTIESLENLLKIQPLPIAGSQNTIFQLTNQPLKPLTQAAKLRSRAQLLGKRLILIRGLGRALWRLSFNSNRGKVQIAAIQGYCIYSKVYLTDFYFFQGETTINVTVLSIYATKAQPKLLCAALPTKWRKKLTPRLRERESRSEETKASYCRLSPSL